MFLCLNFPGSLGTFNKLYHFDLTPVLVNLQLTSDETLIHQKTFSRATQSFIFCSSRQKYYFFCSKNPIFAYISCGLCCSSWCTNPSLIWVDLLLRLQLTPHCNWITVDLADPPPHLNNDDNSCAGAFKSKLLISYYCHCWQYYQQKECSSNHFYLFDLFLHLQYQLFILDQWLSRSS